MGRRSDLATTTPGGVTAIRSLQVIPSLSTTDMNGLSRGPNSDLPVTGADFRPHVAPAPHAHSHTQVCVGGGHPGLASK